MKAELRALVDEFRARHRGIVMSGGVSQLLSAADKLEAILNETPEQARPRMLESQARRVLSEYPDADLSAFDVIADVDRIAADGVSRVVGIISDRIAPEQAARERLGRWLAEKPMRQWNIRWHMGRCEAKVCDNWVTVGPFCDSGHEAINAALDKAEGKASK